MKSPLHRAPVLAALAGIASGVLATIPLLGLALNCLCCASVWGSTAAAVLWENRRGGVAMAPRDGALFGLITGIVSGAVAAAFIVLLTFDPREAATLLRESEMRDAAAGLLRLVESGALTAAIAVFTVALHTAVGVLSGAATAAVIARQQQR